MAIIVAGGQGKRVGGATPKQFLEIGSHPMLQWSTEVFARHPGVDDLIVVVPAAEAHAPPGWLLESARVVCGGGSRAESVRAGLAASPEAGGVTLVHAGARPFVTEGLISRVLEAARSSPAIPVLPVVDTIKCVDDSGWIVDTPPRASLRAAQTPQGFPTAVLRRVHEEAAKATSVARPTRQAVSTDDALECERTGVGVRTLEGEAWNLKVTTAEDLAYARWLVDCGLITYPNHGGSTRGGAEESAWSRSLAFFEPAAPDGTPGRGGPLQWRLRARGRAAIRLAAHMLDTGGVLAHPTATVYGLGARPDPDLDARIAGMKGRQPGPLIRVAADLVALKASLPEAIWTENAERLAEVFWPGPLSLVLDDGTEDGVAVRVAAHPALRAVLCEAGGLMTSTSLNASGQSAARSRDEVPQALGSLQVSSGPLGWLDAGDLGSRDPSTVVSVRGGGIHVLREGAVPAARVFEVVSARPGGGTGQGGGPG